VADAGVPPDCPHAPKVEPQRNEETEDYQRLPAPGGPQVVRRERLAVVDGKDGKGGKEWTAIRDPAPVSIPRFRSLAEPGMSVAERLRMTHLPVLPVFPVLPVLPAH
jgi:hypothetical protein